MKTVIIKIGSGTLLTKQGSIDEFQLTHLIEQVSILQKNKASVILVLSGAVASGLRGRNMTETDISKQVAAGIGQVALISKIYKYFGDSDIIIAQLLLTPDSFSTAKKREKIKAVLAEYARSKTVAVINENDVLELNGFGGNDLLAADIATLVNATQVLILSQMTPSTHGIGGGKTKMEAVKALKDEGIRVEIVNGKKQNVIIENMEYLKRDLPKKSESLSEWYNKIVLSAELADYGPAKGTMIFRPYGYAIWELIQKEMDNLIKEKGVSNAYFPLFIPESLLKKEQKHIEGFSPELAIVTIGGGEELQEKLVIRPTSETIMYEAYSRWVRSWRDLPLLINQWNNAVRWEKRTYLFLRTTEFLWQEGHTAHATHKEAREMVLWAIQMYSRVYRELFAMSGYIGKKSDSEKFAGADTTLTFEALMPEGKALQSCTSHDLGQSFSKVFNIKFQTAEGKTEHAWQTSWGFSTRSIGGLIMTHGDDRGLNLPPRLSPIQVIILPVKETAEVLSSCVKIEDILKESEIRVKIDNSDNETLGSKINKWELKGVPLRVEIGPKEIEQDIITIVRRDTGEKSVCKFNQISAHIEKLLELIHENLLRQSEIHLAENTREIQDYNEFQLTLTDKRGFLLAFWCEAKECEEKIKEETKATTRCLPLEPSEQNGKCVYCGKPAKHRWLFAQAY